MTAKWLIEGDHVVRRATGFQIPGLLRKFSQNYRSHPTFVNDLHGTIPNLGNAGAPEFSI